MVILTAASGQQLPLNAPITAANVDRYRPAPRAAENAAALLRKAGFEVGPTVGIGFSVTGTPALFERYFKRPVRLNPAGEVVFDTAAGQRLELPADALPAELRPTVQGVVFSPRYELDR
jgi:hypothetical protein